MTENKRTLWFDENSQPPRNYIWYKNGKFWEFVDGKWVESEGLGGNGGGNTIYDSIEEVANPKEGDIVVCPDKYEEVGVASNGNPITLNPLKEYKLEVVEQPVDGSLIKPAVYQWSSPTYEDISYHLGGPFSGYSQLSINTGQVKVLEHTVEAYNKEYYNGEWIDRDSLSDVINELNLLNTEVEESCQKVWRESAINKQSYVLSNHKLGDVVTFEESFSNDSYNSTCTSIKLTFSGTLPNYNSGLNGISKLYVGYQYMGSGAGSSSYTKVYTISIDASFVPSVGTYNPYYKIEDQNGKTYSMTYNYTSAISSEYYCILDLPTINYFYTYGIFEESVEPAEGGVAISLRDYLTSVKFGAKADPDAYQVGYITTSMGQKNLSYIPIKKIGPLVWQGEFDFSSMTNNSSLLRELKLGNCTGIIKDNQFYNIDYASDSIIRFANREFNLYTNLVTFGYQDTVTLTTAPTTDIDTVEELEDLGFTSDVFDKINKGLITYIKIGNDSYKIINYDYNPSYYTGVNYVKHYSVTFGNYNITKNVGVDTTVIVTINN